MLDGSFWICPNSPFGFHQPQRSLEASARDRQNGNRLRFIPSNHDAVQRVIALTDTAEMFEWES